MNEDRFHELLNEYLDGEISRQDFGELKKAIETTPRYRKIFEEYKRLQTAQIIAPAAIAATKKTRRPLTGFFSAPRLLRSGAILANCSVLLLTVGICRQPELADPRAEYTFAAGTAATAAGTNTAPAAGETGISTEKISTPPASQPSAINYAPAQAPEQAPPAAAVAGISAEDYGFVRF